MKSIIKYFATAALACCAAGCTKTQQNMTSTITSYSDVRFADIQMLRYEITGWEDLTLQQKEYVYYLSQAALCGRDICFDQMGKYNLRIRTLLENIYTCADIDHETTEFQALREYLYRVWFVSGIYHHYSSDKFIPGFSQDYLLACTEKANVTNLVDDELLRVIFDANYLAKRTNQDDGDDLVQTSAVNFYEGVTQQEAEGYYRQLDASCDSHCPSWGLNSRLVKGDDGAIREEPWRVGGIYSAAIEQIVGWLGKARNVAENDKQKELIASLIDFYRTGNLVAFDDYSIQWAAEVNGDVDFTNGFIEVYDDPIGRKGTWEALVNFKDKAASVRTQKICENAQWFEDHSPVDKRFKKEEVKGVSAKAINAAVLAGALYPATAIGINLPNSSWIRSEYGSKSVTITNITDAYDRAAQGNGFNEEFIGDETIIAGLDQYGKIYDDLHTDLHECLGHGSGKMLPGVSAASLGSYHSAIEETRADLFGLYYMADKKLVELGITPNETAHESYYYRYIMNGALTQLSRIEEGKNIEEAHMQNRALVARWCMEKAPDVVKLTKRDDKTYVEITDYKQLRGLFAELLGEIQRITSEGDSVAARSLIETYAKKVDAGIHHEIRERNNRLNLAPYKGFINPVIKPVCDEAGKITDFTVEYGEAYDEQMLRYSREYGFLKVGSLY